MQAVIAIENAAQFNALETLNAELGDRVQEQVGEIERMGRPKRFLPAAVADTVVSSGSEKMLSSHQVMLCDWRWRCARGCRFCAGSGGIPLDRGGSVSGTLPQTFFDAFALEVGTLARHKPAGRRAIAGPPRRSSDL